MTNDKFFLQIDYFMKRMIEPALVAIYAPHAHRDILVNQVGTGFLITHNNQPVLVTAAHVFYGADGNEQSDQKAFFWKGNLHYIGARKIVADTNIDVAVCYANELATKPQLNRYSLTSPSKPTRLLTVGGYLSRDFKRVLSSGMLSPAPRIFTNESIIGQPDLISMKYERRRFKNTYTGQRITAPIPRGLSGGPMVDSATLHKPEPIIVGIFTEYDKGVARGASSPQVHKLINQL